MASRIFPNTIIVEGFPSSMSRYDFLLIFGGSKGHIDALEIMHTDGEPKAFIRYEHANSVPLALEMKGSHLFNHPYALDVQVVDEHVLCHHVPGENYDAGEALANLQRVLFSVLASRDQARSTYHTNLTAMNQRSLAMIDELEKKYERYKIQKEEERDRDANLLRTVAQLETTTNRCKILETGNRVLQDRVKEAEVFERESGSKLTLVSGQLQNITGRCTQLQTEIDDLRARLTEVDSELKVERQRSDSESKKEVEELQRQLEETTAQKEQTIESLGLAKNAVLRLQEELRTEQQATEVAQSSQRRAKSAVEGVDGQVRALQNYVTQTQKKHQRAEEDLMDERDAKRRLVEERDSVETRCRSMADEATQYQAEGRLLKERLRAETHQRKRAEESLAEADAKLDRVPIIDSLTAVFLKFDQILLEVVKEASPPDDSSTS